MTYEYYGRRSANTLYHRFYFTLSRSLRTKVYAVNDFIVNGIKSCRCSHIEKILTFKKYLYYSLITWYTCVYGLWNLEYSTVIPWNCARFIYVNQKYMFVVFFGFFYTMCVYTRVLAVPYKKLELEIIVEEQW